MMKKTILPLAILLLVGLTFMGCQKESITIPMNGSTNLGTPPPTLVDQEINIQVSPNVLNLLSITPWLTIHADIGFSQVVGSSVTLNGLAIHHYFADSRGDFVAKFSMNEVKAYPWVVGVYNTFTMTGTTTTGTFIGTQDVLVLSNVPSGSGRN